MPSCDPDSRDAHRASDDAADDLRGRRAERHADAELLRSRYDAERNDGIDAGERERERDERRAASARNH